MATLAQPVRLLRSLQVEGGSSVLERLLLSQVAKVILPFSLGIGTADLLFSEDMA
jgi:hypothetical protein